MTLLVDTNIWVASHDRHDPDHHGEVIDGEQRVERDVIAGGDADQRVTRLHRVARPTRHRRGTTRRRRRRNRHMLSGHDQTVHGEVIDGEQRVERDVIAGGDANE